MAISLPIVSTFDPKGVRKAQEALKDFGRFAADMAKLGAAAVTAVGVAGVREFAQFETSFAKIEGLVGVSTAEVEKLEEAARRLAPEFGKSANEAADALFFITSAGLRGSDAVDVLEASLKASAAGLGDMNSIANAATASMNTYGPSVLSGTDAVEALTEAVRLGQFAPEELASALGRVVPISAELGVSFQETTGLVAALTKGGLSASEAVTGIRGAMQAVLKPSGEAAKMLEEYGFTTEEVRDSIERDGLLATFERLREAFGDNEEDFTRVIGSIEGLNAVLALTGENNEAYRQIVQDMTDDVGVLDEAFGAVSETAQFKFDSAMAQTKETLLGIGEDLLERLLPYLEEFNTFMEENGPAIREAFDRIYGAVEGVVIQVQDFIAGLVEKPEFQEFLALLRDTFVEIDEKAQGVIATLLDLAENAFILLIDTINENYETLENLASIFDDIAFFANEVIDGFEGTQTETDNVVQTFLDALTPLGRAKDAIKAIADALNAVREAYEKLKGRTGLDFKFREDFVRNPYIQPRAVGGSVMGGSAYLVGERGPELFIPSSGGQILANGQTSRMGDGPTYNITVQAGVGDPVTIGREVVTAIKRFERANGPVFASA